MGGILKNNKVIREKFLECRTVNSQKYFGKKTSLKHKGEENSSAAHQQYQGIEITYPDPTDHTSLKNSDPSTFFLPPLYPWQIY